MGNILKTIKPVTVIGSLIASGLIYTAFKRSRKKIVTIKKWVNWKIKFKKDASNEEKAQAIIAVKKYIFDHVSSFGIEIISIKFLINPDDYNLTNSVDLIVDVIEIYSKQPVRTPIPPHPPIVFPSDESFRIASRNIINIHNNLQGYQF